MSEYEHTFENGSTLEVQRQGRELDPSFRGYRDNWTLILRSGERQYVETLRSGIGSSMSPEEAAYVALDFMSAFFESSEGGENADLFPSWVREAFHSDEVEWLGIELGYTEDREPKF